MDQKTELQWNAIFKARRQELDSYQRALDIQWLNSRMEDGGMGRCLALIQKEADMEKEFQERTDHAAIVNARAAKEIALGTEIANICREETCEQLRRHYLRERDPSLRELARKLHAGYVCRDLRLQIQNNEYKRLQDEAEERHADAILANSIYNYQEAQEKEDREKLHRSIDYRKELQQQLVNREQQRRCMFEDTLIEKKMLEDVMRTIADEDQRELAQKRENTIRLQKEMAATQLARAAWRQKQRETVVQEEREIERQRAAVGDRDSAIIAERERKRREKEELNEKIVSKILADEMALQERTNIIAMLQEQETLEKNVQDDITEKEIKERKRRETNESLAKQMESRRQAERELRQREMALRGEAEAKMAAEKQKEREKEIEKRKKGRQYSEELLQQIRANEQKRALEKKMEEDRVQNVWDYQKAWQQEVTNERKHLIRSHAPSLLGYMQAGVLKRDDMQAVREGAESNPHLAGLEIEKMVELESKRRFMKCNDQCKVLREY